MLLCHQRGLLAGKISCCQTPSCKPPSSLCALQKQRARWTRATISTSKSSARDAVVLELGCLVDYAAILVEAGYRAAAEMWPQRLTESSSFFVQKAHTLTSINEPSDIVFWVRCIQDEVLTGRRQRAQGNRRTRPLRLAAISQLFNGEEEDLVTVAVLRWSVEEGTTRDELQAQARHHFSIALQQLALSASTSPAPTTRTGALADNHHVGLGSGLDLACCQHLHPYSPVVETVRANASSALSSSASGGGSSSPRRRMAIVSPVLPHALATYVLQRCGLEEAVSMLTPTWEQGVLQTSPSPQPSTSCSNISSSSGSSSSRSGGQDLWQSDQAIQDSGWRGVAAQGHGEDNERPAHLTHLFTPNLAHAQRMVRELGSSASSRTRSTTNSSSTSNSRDQATYSSAGRRGLTPSSSSSAWRDALEHAFSSSNSSSGSGSSRADTNNVKDDEHSQQGWQSGPFLGPKVQQMCFEVHLAEWACSSQPSRAKALGHEGLHLTDEVRLAELAGCASSRAVLDGVEWQ